MKAFRAWREKNASFSLALSLLFLFVGAYLSCPAAGLAATLPAGFAAFLAAALVKPGFILPPAAAGIFALGLSYGLGIVTPFLFAAATAFSALLAALFAAALDQALFEKKRLLLLPAALLLALGIALPLFVCGTPGGLAAARTAAAEHLAGRYPDQTFARITVYRDPMARAWHADCDFDYEGKRLTSVLTLGDETADGHLSDRMSVMLETRRSALIEALRDGEEPVLVEPWGFSGELAARESFAGVYGSYDEELEKEMDFSLTFRREKTEKRDFALAVRGVMEDLAEKGEAYHRIRFVAQAAGETVFTCTVSPETVPAELLDLIQRAS